MARAGDASWGLESGACSRLKEKTSDKTPVSVADIDDYQTYLINKARKLDDPQLKGKNDFLVLAHLQHLGAATNLIDFTYNPMLALYFACEKEPDRDGKVFFIDRRIFEAIPMNPDAQLSQEEQKEFDAGRKPICWDTPRISSRIFKQDGLFIIAKSGRLSAAEGLSSYTVSRTNKQDVLKKLALMGISEETVYPDLEGLAKFNHRQKEWPDKDELFSMALFYGNQNQPERAAKLFQKLVDINPDDAEAWYNLGTAYAGQEKYKEAEEAYREAVRINPDDAKAWNNLGKYYDQAAKACQKALEINPDLAEARYNLGNLYRGQEKYKAAEEAYLKAISINPDYAEAWHNLGVTYKATGER
ncbi:hypothetical protein CHS0354_018502 [Potamilus streckersoni]|uniref:Cell division cycle protein 27 homolog n=1 Tax=Potamilus streckersoni TaxID=2493646 RepID=A0AAE0TAQ3_9BIVA|nr:hypothetical protein CHS0354_018502 [Potamilus streckersoni]